MGASKTAFQIGLAYWLSDQGLRRCTHEERGVWLEVLCLMHQAEERGILRWPLQELAEAVKAPIGVLESLVLKGVMGGRSSTSLPDDELYACSQIPFVYTPRHSGRHGEPVILIDEVEGDVWFSPEMVIEEHKRQKQVESSARTWSDKRAVVKKDARAQAVEATSEAVKVAGGRKVPDCPYGELVDVFMDVLPAARKVRLVTPESGLGKSLKARWRAAAVAPEGAVHRLRDGPGGLVQVASAVRVHHGIALPHGQGGRQPRPSALPDDAGMARGTRELRQGGERVLPP